MIIVIDRSLCQTNDGLVFKSTKTEEPRKVELPPSILARLEAHRLRQDEFRQKFGPDYRSDLDLIFANADGSPLMPKSISSTVARLCRRLGLPKGASRPCLATQPCESPAGRRRRENLATVSARLDPLLCSCARPPTSTRTPSAARTMPPSGVGTTSCSDQHWQGQRNPRL